MDSLRQDPELAAEMVGLMGRELRIARKKAEELERELTAERKRVSTLEASYTTEKERAEAAEYTRDIFKLNMEKFGKQGKRLLRELEHNKKEIKKEREEFVLGSSSDGGLDQKMKVEQSEVEKKLWDDHADIRSKYDIQLLENQTLRQTCEASESRIKTLEAEKAELNKKLEETRVSGQQKVLELETQIKRMEVQMTLFPSREPGDKIDPDPRLSLERPDFQEFLSKLTIPPSHPQFHRLYPIQNSQIDLNQYLPRILSAAHCSTDFLYFPGRLTWSKSMTYALVFSPFSMIGAQLGPWERSHEVSSLQGYKRELFYSNDTSVYYAGTFRCIETSKWFPEGIVLPSSISAEAIAEVALGKNSTCSAPYKATISKSFADGIIKVECMVLECVGFSRYLYNALLEEYSPDTSLKRSSAYSDEDSNKKPRWKMG